MSFPRALALALLIVVSSNLSAEVWDGAPFAADPKALLAAAEAIQPQKPEEGVLVLLDEAVVTFDAQGRSKRVERLIYRVIDQSAVDGWGTIDTSWSPWYHQRPEVDARVITKDGDVHRLDPKSFGIEDAEDEPDMFSDTRILSGPLPAVAPGSVIEQTITYREKNPLYDAGVSERYQFGRWVETRQSRLVLEYPSTLALRMSNKSLPRIDGVKSEADGVTRIVFETGPRPAMERSEWNLPSDTTTISYVAWSTGKSWQDVARRYAEIIDQKIADTTPYAKLTAATVGKTKDPKEIAAKILAAVERQIRYAGVEFGEGSIVPRTPAETLNNKYGDCKDKATLLVAMLRQAGVPAHVALLRSGQGYDVDPDLPGLGHFNHVIVVTEGPNPIWIDPTDEFARAGELPDSDQGRLALIAKADTTALTLTPLDVAAANRVVEQRVFRLVEDGKAFVTETTDYSGSEERATRRYYTSIDQKQAAEGLKEYAESAYLAKKVAKWSTSDANDLSKPFRIHIEMEEATRGSTGDGEAAVGIFMSRLIGDLPSDLQRDAEKIDAEAEEEDDKYKPRKHDYVFTRPYVLELHYRIEPPPGYTIRSLPDADTLKLGTATITRQYKVQDDGVVLADFRFDSGPRRITAAQYEELRTAAVKLNKEPALLVYFDQVARKLIDEGEVGKGIAELRRLSALHPKEALHHNDIARALLSAGFGEAARAEARKAVAVEPKSAKAHATLAYMLVHDLIGRELRTGCDVPAAIAEYRKAKELAPDNLSIRGELAVVLQHNDHGHRYAEGARLNEAIDEYVSIKKDIEDADDAAIDRELMLLYAHTHRWADLKKLVAETTDTKAKDQYRVIAIGATEGGAAAVAATAALDPSVRREVQTAAGGLLALLRYYPAAAELVSAAAPGAPNASQLRQQAEVLRKTVRHEELKLDAATPASFLKTAFLDVFNDTPRDVLNQRFATKDVADVFGEKGRRELAREEQNKSNKALFLKKDPQSVLIADFAMSAIEITQDGDEKVGLRLRGRAPGAGNVGEFTIYMVREKDQYRMAGSDDSTPELALRALRLAEENDVAAARRWLDWAREHVSGGGDDPVASEPFAGVWTRGKEATTDEIRLAAAVLLPETKKSSELALPVLAGARDSASPDVQWRIDQAMLTAYTTLERWEDALAASDRLVARFPDSASAFIASASAMRKLKRDDELRQRALARLEKMPGDMAALQVLGELALHHHQYAEAVRHFSAVLDRANATAGDYNEHAWAMLFAKGDLEKALDHARHAAGVAPVHSILNTLAALYAEQGRSAEAHETLLKSIAEQDEPEDADWYVLGRIAENYGITDVAAAAYAKLKKPERVGGSSWELAQARLAAMNRR